MLLQNILVAVAVIFCTFYAAWLLTPARPRLRAVQWLTHRLPGSGPLHRVALRLTEKAARRLEQACGGCASHRGTTGSAPR